MSRRFPFVSYYYFLGFCSFISGINHRGFIFRCEYIRMVWCAKICLENWCAHMQKSGSKTVEDDQLIKSSSSRHTKEAGERKKSHIDSMKDRILMHKLFIWTIQQTHLCFCVCVFGEINKQFDTHTSPFVYLSIICCWFLFRPSVWEFVDWAQHLILIIQ